LDLRFHSSRPKTEEFSRASGLFLWHRHCFRRFGNSFARQIYLISLLSEWFSKLSSGDAYGIGQDTINTPSSKKGIETMRKVFLLFFALVVGLSGTAIFAQEPTGSRQ